MIKSDGGSSSYYDLPRNSKTLNDLMEWKADTQWLGDAFHLSNLMKAAWRWGTKEGTDKAYDARKIMYYGARLLMKYAGKEGLNQTLRAMLDDEQFRPDDVEPLSNTALKDWQKKILAEGYQLANPSDPECGVAVKVDTSPYIPRDWGRRLTLTPSKKSWRRL